MTISSRTADDYENLRAAVLGAEAVRGLDLVMLRQRGMTSWLKAPVPEPIAQHPRGRRDRSSGAGIDPPPMATELTRLIAGIVVALAAEPAHG
jgi:hypothetical protein